MKKLTLLFAFFLTLMISHFASAQTFTFMPGELVTEYVELESYKNIQVDMVHPGFDDITFGWVTIENNLLDKWEYSSCDNGGCYSLLPDSATVGPLADTVPGYIRITVNPRDQLGTSTVQIYVYNIKYPNEGKFVTFEIIATPITSIFENTSESMKVFPNPASDFLTVENPTRTSSTFELCDLSGKTILLEFINPLQSKTFGLSNYPDGIYFARFNNETTRKIIIQ